MVSIASVQSSRSRFTNKNLGVWHDLPFFLPLFIALEKLSSGRILIINLNMNRMRTYEHRYEHWSGTPQRTILEPVYCLYTVIATQRHNRYKYNRKMYEWNWMHEYVVRSCVHAIHEWWTDKQAGGWTYGWEGGLTDRWMLVMSRSRILFHRIISRESILFHRISSGNIFCSVARKVKYLT